MLSDAGLIVYRLRKVAKRTSEQDSDHALFVDAAEALEAAVAERASYCAAATYFEADRNQLNESYSAVCAERDALAEQVAGLQAELAQSQWALDDAENAREDNARMAEGLQAVIAEVRGHIGQENTDSWHATKLRRVREVLSQPPADALEAHDRQVAAKALTDAADAWGSEIRNGGAGSWLRARAGRRPSGRYPSGAPAQPEADRG